MDYASIPGGIGSRILPGVSKVLEESCETGQVLAKILAMGSIGIYWDGTDLNKCLIEEIGDLEATLEYLKAKNKLDRKAIKKRKKLKLDKFGRWHKNVRSGRSPNDNGTKVQTES